MAGVGEPRGSLLETAGGRWTSLADAPREGLEDRVKVYFPLCWGPPTEPLWERSGSTLAGIPATPAMVVLLGDLSPALLSSPRKSALRVIPAVT